MENAKECLDREFEGNNWTIKRATETLQADVIWYQCTKCTIRLKIVPYLESNDAVMIEMTKENHEHSDWESRKTYSVIREPARSKIIEYEKMSKYFCSAL